MDTIPQNTSTTEVLTPGGSRTSTIDTLGDRDWFRVDLTGGYTYDIILEGTGSPTELGTVEYYIYDSSGNFIANEPDFGTAGIERNSFTPTLDGIYYIAAAADGDNDTGDYILSLGNDDARNTVDTQQTITAGGSVSGTIDAFGDRDWYEISLEVGFSYQVTIEGTGTATGLGQVEYLIYDSSGVLLTNEPDFGTAGIETNTFSPTADGVYYIAASGDSTNDLGDYVLSVGTDDVRASVDTEFTLSAGGSVTGTIDTFDDRDWYEISLEAGFSYQVIIEGTGTATELGAVEYLIYDSEGTLITNEPDFGNAGIETNTFSPTADGVYYIAASGDSVNDLGDYILSVGTDDVRAGVETQASIDVGGSVTGTIDTFNDRDWYEIEFEAGFSYNITLQGTGTATEVGNVEFLVYDGNGNLLANEPDFGLAGIEEAIFSPTSDGTYYIVASGDASSDLGDYILSVDADDARQTVETDRTLAIGSAVAGEIEGFGDSDWYEVTLEADTEYTITLEGDGSTNSLGRVEFSVRDLTGTVLLNESDFGQLGIETATFTPTTSGQYYISAAGDTTSARGNYVLSLEGDRPLTVGSNEDDILVGDSADENFSGLAGEDTIVGGGGDDIAHGGDDDDVLIGSAGNDQLNGDGGDDALFGNADNDVLDGGSGSDALNGGSGDDTAGYASATSMVRADLEDAAVNVGDAAGDSYTSIENLTGSAFNDNLRGDGGSNTIQAGDGDDMLFGREGDDVLEGGIGSDTLNGGSDNDIADYSGSTAFVRADLDDAGFNQGDAAGDTFVSIEGLGGSAFDDTFRSGNDDNILIGRDGDDRLISRGGDDVLNGGEGADLLNGGGGNDTSDHSDADADVRADLNDVGFNRGEALGDTYISIENLTGGAFDDTLRGDAIRNTLIGGDGEDRLFGRGGRDTFDGGAGDDFIGSGGGRDIFLFRNGDGDDVISDFVDDFEVLTFVDTGLGFGDLNITDTAAGAEVDYGTGTVTLEGITASQLDADDFEFV